MLLSLHQEAEGAAAILSSAAAAKEDFDDNRGTG